MKVCDSGLETVMTTASECDSLRARMCDRVSELTCQVDAGMSVGEIVALAYTAGVGDIADVLASAGDTTVTDGVADSLVDGVWVAGYREGLQAAGRVARSCRDMAVMLHHPSSCGWSR